MFGLRWKAARPAQSRHFFGQLLARQPARRVIPARQPENHAEKTKSCRRHIHILQFPLLLQCDEDVAHELEVSALPFADLAALFGRQASLFVHENGDGADSARQEPDVTGDDASQTFLAASRRGACGLDDLGFESIHTVIHDVREQFLFSANVVVEARLC